MELAERKNSKMKMNGFTVFINNTDYFYPSEDHEHKRIKKNVTNTLVQEFLQAIFPQKSISNELIEEVKRRRMILPATCEVRNDKLIVIETENGSITDVVGSAETVILQ